jgi:D-3-phosphoglycerate dehydrogenase / 2-oxoglutarate reductase
MKILLTSTSFQDTPGSHHNLLDSYNFDVVKMRGPLKEEVILDVIADFDGVICGDDEITSRVIEKGAKSKLKILSKYGIGLDKVDLDAAKEFNIPVANTPGVNNTTVAEHVFALMLCYSKNLIKENELIQNQNWTKLIGTELFQKTLGIIGLGHVGKEVAKRASAFGMKIIVFDKYVDSEFVEKLDIEISDSIEELVAKVDYLSLNASLNEDTRGLINANNIQKCRKGIVIINTARAGLVDNDAIMWGLDNKIINGYLTDVLEEEPMVLNHPFLNYENIIITPHIGSRTYENVVRQGTWAINNLVSHLNIKNE